jgi:hypothetical protein
MKAKIKKVKKSKSEGQDDFDMPKWMDCGWRRKNCGRDDCPLCGRINRDRQRHIDRGEDPDSMKSVMEDVGNNFREALTMIKADATAQGIDITNIEDIEEPPEPAAFPLYLEVNRWRESIFELAENCDETESVWLYTDSGKDLMWYANTLAAKTYRQLCNRWHIDNGDDYGDFDLKYNKYVLDECLKILCQALNDLIKSDTPHRKKFQIALLLLDSLRLKVGKI